MNGMGVTYPLGFRAAAVEAAVKKPGRNDLAILVSDCPCAAAAVFTRNLFAAAPVLYSRRIIEQDGSVRAIVVNSGNANAGTGETGLRDAESMATLTGSGLGIGKDEVLVASTGVIGRPMPMDRIAAGIGKACAVLARDGGGAGADAGLDVARAIMTTDTVEKIASRTVSGREGEIRIGGICKGAGMIHPDMATMLAFLTTDAALSSDVLHPMLRRAADKTFNAVSVDNDMSTNDSAFLLANGAAGDV
ncbi:MAG: bifunctional ornithine acetyltransferase/N-acetylglutamate synthase, partial [Candidatus Hydrogenedentota bacterium]